MSARRALGHRGLELISSTAERLREGEDTETETPVLPSPRRKRKQQAPPPSYITPTPLRKKARRQAEKLSIRSREGEEAARRYEDKVKTRPAFHRGCVDFLEVGLSFWHMRDGEMAREERKGRKP